MTPKAQRYIAPDLTARKLPTRGLIWANTVLAGGGAITTIVFVYYFYHYVWLGDRRFVSWHGVGLNLIAPGALSAFLLASLRMSSSHKIRVATLCFSLTALLLGAELILEQALANSILGIRSRPLWGISADTKNIVAKLARKSGIEYDMRDSREVLAEKRNRGIDAVPGLMLGSVLGAKDGIKFNDSINGAEFIPLGAIANKSTVLCNESGRYVSYESDEHGFRNPRGIWNSAHADVAALGESFVQGYCVPNGEHFVDLFRKQYPVTLNLGTSGESALLQLAAIKEYLPRYTPKLVLWFFCERVDIYDLQSEAKNPFLRQYLERNFTQHLFTQQDKIDRALRSFMADLERHAPAPKPASRDSEIVNKSLEIIKLSYLRQKLGYDYGITKDEQELLRSENPMWGVLRDALLQAQTLASSWGGTLYFVYLPSWERYGKNPTVPEIERTRVLKLVRPLGVPIIDVQPAFQAHNDPLSLFQFRIFGHYNEMGNQIVAERVLQIISGHGMAMQ